MQRTALALFLIASFSLWTGCGKDTNGRVGVSGTITLKGEPLDSGTIQFAATDGSLLTGATINDGEYEVPATQGLLPGTYTVRVSSVEEAATAEAAPGESRAAEARNKELIPAEFNVNSNVKAEIKEDSDNTFDLEIP